VRRFAPWWVIAMVVALLVLPPRGAQAADTVTDGGWSYFGDPRAIYANGRTFVGWTTSSGQVQVGSFRKGSSDDVSTVDQVSDPGHANDGPDAIATVDQFGVDDHRNRA
jgi:hypothetical protein